MQLGYKLWLENGGKAFGDGPLRLLAEVEATGSLRKAAASMGMSYTKAWHLVDQLEDRLGFPLLVKQVGGASGGGSTLTAGAFELLHRYAAFRREADSALATLFHRHFPEGETGTWSGAGRMAERTQ